MTANKMFLLGMENQLIGGWPVTLSNDPVLFLLPLTLQPTVGFGLSNNVLPFFPICHQLSPSSHSQYLKISFYFLFPSFSWSSPSSRPFQFLSEDLFGHPILLHSPSYDEMRQKKIRLVDQKPAILIQVIIKIIYFIGWARHVARMGERRSVYRVLVGKPEGKTQA